MEGKTYISHVWSVQKYLVNYANKPGANSGQIKWASRHKSRKVCKHLARPFEFTFVLVYLLLMVITVKHNTSANKTRWLLQHYIELFRKVISLHFYNFAGPESSAARAKQALQSVVFVYMEKAIQEPTSSI